MVSSRIYTVAWTQCGSFSRNYVPREGETSGSPNEEGVFAVLRGITGVTRRSYRDSHFSVALRLPRIVAQSPMTLNRF